MSILESESSASEADDANDEVEAAMDEVSAGDGVVPESCGALSTSGKTEGEYRPALKKPRFIMPAREDPLVANPRDAVRTLELHFQPVGIEPKYRFTYSQRRRKYECVLTAGSGVARGKGQEKNRAKAEAAADMLMQLQCGEWPDESKAHDVHGPVTLVSMSKEPNLGRVSQADVDAWGDVDIANAVAAFKARVEGQSSLRESGDPRTNTPRRYGLSLGKKQRKHSKH
jgi:hypothetical protein